jgi:hypothetical protein
MCNKALLMILGFGLLLGGCIEHTFIPVLESTVRVGIPGKNGTGTIVEVNHFGDVDEVFILTAYHGVMNDRYPLVTFYKYNKLLGISSESYMSKGSVHHTLPMVDLALIWMLIPSGHVNEAAIFASSLDTVRVGTELYSIGCCDGFAPLVGEGLLAKWRESPPYFGMYSGGVTFGHSGGGIYTKNGKLVGIIVGLLRPKKDHISEHLGIFIPVDRRVVDFMKDEKTINLF